MSDDFGHEDQEALSDNFGIREISLRRRTLPESLHYLAKKLEEDGTPEYKVVGPVAASLHVIANQLDESPFFITEVLWEYAKQKANSKQDMAEYVASGIAINRYIAFGDDLTMGDMDDIFRTVFRAGVRFAKEPE